MPTTRAYWSSSEWQGRLFVPESKSIIGIIWRRRRQRLDWFFDSRKFNRRVENMVSLFPTGLFINFKSNQSAIIRINDKTLQYATRKRRTDAARRRNGQILHLWTNSLFATTYRQLGWLYLLGRVGGNDCYAGQDIPVIERKTSLMLDIWPATTITARTKWKRCSAVRGRLPGTAENTLPVNRRGPHAER